MLRQKRVAFAIPALFLSVLVGTLFALSFLFAPRTLATTGINEQVNYQGRLLDSTGAIVPDGTYNMEFKVYQDGDGCVSGGSSPCSGTLEWTETRKQTNRVTVTNGYFAVQLGSVTPFSTNIDWNQDTLWLSINIGGTANTASPTWDGEMTPFRRLSASPYALNAKQLGGLDWSKFVQVAPSAVQTDSTMLATLFLNKTGASGNILQLQKSGNDVFVIDNSGEVGVGGITSPGAAGIEIGADSGNSNGVQLRLRDTGAGANGYWDISSIFNNTNTDLLFKSNGTERVRFDVNGNVGFGSTNPTSAVQIDKGTATESFIKFTAGTTTGTTATDGLDIGIGASGAAYINQRENAGILFNTNNTTHMTIGTAGGVGIGTGTTASLTRLQVHESTASTANTILVTNAATGQTGGNGLFLQVNSAGNGIINMVRSGATMGFGVAGTTFMYITSSGDIQIGNSPSDTTGTLLVLDGKTNSGDPTGTEGGMYYNGNDDKFRCFEASEWKDCISPTTVTVRKSADEAVALSTTLQNDDDLFFDVGTNQTWAYRFTVATTAGATGDFKANLSMPSGSTCNYTSTATFEPSNFTDVIVSDCSVVTNWNWSSSGTAIYEYQGTVVTGGTAGTVQFQWAQRASDITSTTVFGGYSFLTAHRID